MILILSTPRDTDTQIVVDWLQFYKAPFFRLNDEDIMTGDVSFNLSPNNIENSYLERLEGKIYFKDVKVVWLRKFGFLKTYEDVFGKKSGLTRYMYSEFSVIRSLIFKLLESKHWLYKRTNMLTKLEVLNLAHKNGLKIPNTIITTNKKKLKSFFYANKRSIISKSLGEGKHIEYLKKNYSFFTQIIKSLDNITDKFTPSLFQEYIDKKYELRVFF